MQYPAQYPAKSVHKMPVQLGVVMDPIGAIQPRKDTTLALLLAAQKRDWGLWYTEPQRLSWRDGEVHAQMCPLEVRDDLQDWFTQRDWRRRPMAELDAVLMRADPPFDVPYIHATHLLEELMRASGTPVINHPRALRDCNEKTFITRFPQCCPPFLISADPEELREFHAAHDDIILKPLDGMGGRSIFRVRQDGQNLGVILETLLEGKASVMAQRYLPEVADGDKRVLLIDGEPAPWMLARIPQAGEVRANLAAGGRGEVRPLGDRERWICGQLREELCERGLFFVGLDIIGDWLTEINVTSPTCMRELDAAKNLDLGAQFMDALERKFLA